MTKIVLMTLITSSILLATPSKECTSYATALAYAKMNLSYSDNKKLNEVKKLGNIPKKCWNAGTGITGNTRGGLNRNYSIQENVDRDVINSTYNAVLQKLRVEQYKKNK